MPPPEPDARFLRASAVIPGALRLAGLSRHFGAIDAVSGITLDVKAGEVVCLLGASGCGKSTLLRLIAGIEAPDAGEIALDGKVISSTSAVLPPEKRGIGLVFQDYALFPHLDAIGNVMFGLSNLSRREALAAADAALRRVGLGHRLRAMPQDLSGGEQQRVALARAIVPRPRVLLMDEPFSNLDRRMRDQVREETITLLRETGATAIIVTHDPEEAMRIADTIVLMRRGRLVQAGPSEALYRQPVDIETARFFCDMNEITGIVKAERLETPLGFFPAPGFEDGARAIAAIRPQGVRLRAAGFCLPGRVVAHRFLGEVHMLDVAVAGLERPLRVRTRNRLGAKAGQDVGVDIRDGEVLVFAANPA